MDNIKRGINWIVSHKLRVLLYFLIINLPLLILTFDTTNWSDDYQYTNFLSVQSQFVSIVSLMFDSVGGNAGEVGRFAPVFMLWNYIFTLFTVDPRFVHLQIVIIFILTAFVLYHIVENFYKDRILALLAGSLFSLNYYIAFKAIAWNCFHSHATNNFTGILSLFFLLRFVAHKKIQLALLSALFLLLTILNLESGFVYVPILFITLLYYWRKGKLSMKHVVLFCVMIGVVISAYPLGSYMISKKWNPLEGRLSSEKSVQGYAFRANELLVNTSGLAIMYNKLIFNNLKANAKLKDQIKRLLRENDKSVLKEISVKYYVMFLALFLGSFLFLAALAMAVAKKVQKDTLYFIYCFLCLFFVYVFVFYRVDVANAISVFSSVILADLIINVLKSSSPFYKGFGVCLSSLLLIAVVWTIGDRFEDSYQKSFFGISTVAIKGPDRIYHKMNALIGRYVKNGLILFTHDHSKYHETIGFDRIGDMLDIFDFVCFNATVYSKDFLKLSSIQSYKDKPFLELQSWIRRDKRYQRLYVSSKKEALDYLKENRINLENMDAIYVSKLYEVESLTDDNL